MAGRQAVVRDFASAGEFQAWYDFATEVDLSAAAAYSEAVFNPPPGSVVQVEAIGFVVTETIGVPGGAGAVVGEVAAYGVSEGAAAAILFDCAPSSDLTTLTAGNAVEFTSDGLYELGTLTDATLTLTPFLLDAEQGDYLVLGSSVQAVAGATGASTGNVRMFIRFRYIKAIEEDFNAAGFFS